MDQQSTPKPYDTVIFDLDGTLVDSATINQHPILRAEPVPALWL